MKASFGPEVSTATPPVAVEAMSNGDEFTALADRLVARILEDSRLSAFAQQIAGMVLDDPRLRQVIREIALRVADELDQRRMHGPVYQFLRAADAARLQVLYDHNLDVLVLTPLERLSPDMARVLHLHRAEITAYVKGRR